MDDWFGFGDSDSMNMGGYVESLPVLQIADDGFGPKGLFGTPLIMNDKNWFGDTGLFGAGTRDANPESLTNMLGDTLRSDYSLARWATPFGSFGVSSPAGSAEMTYGGTSPQPALSVAQESGKPFSFSGLLESTTSTAKGILAAWGGVQGIKYQAAAQKTGAELQQAQLDLQRAQTMGTIDVAKTRAAAEQAVALGQAKVATLNAGYAAQLAQSGGVVGYAAKSYLPMIALGIGAYFIFVKKGK